LRLLAKVPIGRVVAGVGSRTCHRRVVVGFEGTRSTRRPARAGVWSWPDGRPWWPIPDAVFVRIESEPVTGRELRGTRHTWW